MLNGNRRIALVKHEYEQLLSYKLQELEKLNASANGSTSASKQTNGGEQSASLDDLKSQVYQLEAHLQKRTQKLKDIEAQLTAL